MFIPEPSGGNSNTGVCANRFFLKSAITAAILDIDKKVLDTLWVILKYINSTHHMVDLTKWEAAAEACFVAYTQVINPH